MGIKLEYRLELDKFEIEKNVLETVDGKTTYGMVKLTRHDGLNEHEHAVLARISGNAISQMRDGKISNCFFDEVAVHGISALLCNYDADNEDDMVLELQPREGLLLEFEVERGDGHPADKYSLSTCRSEDGRGSYYFWLNCVRYGWRCQVGYEGLSLAYIEEERS